MYLSNANRNTIFYFIEDIVDVSDLYCFLYVRQNGQLCGHPRDVMAVVAKGFLVPGVVSLIFNALAILPDLPVEIILSFLFFVLNDFTSGVFPP